LTRSFITLHHQVVTGRECQHQIE